jgi:hypothetical protein
MTNSLIINQVAKDNFWHNDVLICNFMKLCFNIMLNFIIIKIGSS